METIMLNQREPIISNEGGALFDLGDGIACLEFRSKGNSITPGVREFILDTLDRQMTQFDGLVIGNQSKNFSVGANLNIIKENIERGNSEAFITRVKSFQDMTQRLKSYPKPIVAAPYHMTLGGGLEVALHCHARVATAKAYFGLVEVGVGLLPGGGGVKETARSIAQAPEAQREAALLTGFEKLILRKVSNTAQEAAVLGYLTPDDSVVEEVSDLISCGKKTCLRLAAQEASPYTEKSVALGGSSDYHRLLQHIWQLAEQGQVAPYDQIIGEVIARVLTGGDVAAHGATEAQLLEAERNAFVELTQHKETYQRVCYFLETGKLLNN